MKFRSEETIFRFTSVSVLATTSEARSSPAYFDTTFILSITPMPGRKDSAPRNGSRLLESPESSV
jgi:hypothetical protein